MKVLITGGAGFIGRHLVDSLIARGDEVYAIDDLSTGGLDNVAHLRANPCFHLIIDSIMDKAVMNERVNAGDGLFMSVEHGLGGSGKTLLKEPRIIYYSGRGHSEGMGGGGKTLLDNLDREAKVTALGRYVNVTLLHNADHDFYTSAKRGMGGIGKTLPDDPDRLPKVFIVPGNADHEFSTFVEHGMGGLGKTDLLLMRKLVNVTPLVNDEFSTFVERDMGGTGKTLSNDGPLTSAAVDGTTGSGKISGLLKHIEQFYINAGYGRLLLCANPEERHQWIDWMTAYHRPQDTARFNFLDREAFRADAGVGLTINIVAMLHKLAKSVKDSEAEGGSGKTLLSDKVSSKGESGIHKGLHEGPELVMSKEENPLPIDEAEKLALLLTDFINEPGSAQFTQARDEFIKALGESEEGRRLIYKAYRRNVKISRREVKSRRKLNTKVN